MINSGWDDSDSDSDDGDKDKYIVAVSVLPLLVLDNLKATDNSFIIIVIITDKITYIEISYKYHNNYYHYCFHYNHCHYY